MSNKHLVDAEAAGPWMTRWAVRLQAMIIFLTRYFLIDQIGLENSACRVFFWRFTTHIWILEALKYPIVKSKSSLTLLNWKRLQLNWTREPSSLLVGQRHQLISSELHFRKAWSTGWGKRGFCLASTERGFLKLLLLSLVGTHQGGFNHLGVLPREPTPLHYSS